METLLSEDPGANSGEETKNKNEENKTKTVGVGNLGKDNLSIKKALLFAWQMLRTRPFYITLVPLGIMLLVMSIVALIIIVPIVFGTVAVIFLSQAISSGAIGVIIFLVSLALAVILFIIVFRLIMFGIMFQYRLLLDVITGQERSVKEIFKEVKDTKLASKFFAGIFLYSLLVVFGLILFIFPGIYWGLKYLFVPFLIIDKKVGVKEAFSRSKEMTVGYKGKLFIFFFLMFLILLIPNFLIGGLIMAPVSLIISFYVYLIFNDESNRLVILNKVASAGAIILIFVLSIILNILGIVIDNISNSSNLGS